MIRLVRFEYTIVLLCQTLVETAADKRRRGCIGRETDNTCDTCGTLNLLNKIPFGDTRFFIDIQCDFFLRFSSHHENYVFHTTRENVLWENQLFLEWKPPFLLRIVIQVIFW